LYKIGLQTKIGKMEEIKTEHVLEHRDKDRTREIMSTEWMKKRIPKQIMQYAMRGIIFTEAGKKMVRGRNRPHGLTCAWKKNKNNSNKSPTRCNNFLVYYPDVYLQLNMFRAFSRPSSEAH
jgi:hypothetical protein